MAVVKRKKKRRNSDAEARDIGGLLWFELGKGRGREAAMSVCELEGFSSRYPDVQPTHL